MSPLENIFLALVASNFGNLRRYGFSAPALYESTSVWVSVEAVGENTAIHWTYEFPDEFILCYVLPAHDGIVDRDYRASNDRASWELADYCKKVLNVSETKLNAIKEKAFARKDNRLQCSLAHYKQVFALLDLEQLKEGRFP